MHENLPKLNELLTPYGQVEIYTGRTPPIASLKKADALFIRSGTLVNTAFLKQAPNVRFIGTGTIGTEHLDLTALAQQNIAFASAPGANARSVGEYVLAAALTLAEKKQLSLKRKKALIIGAGHTGTEAGKRLKALGMQVRYLDPNPVRPKPATCMTDWTALKDADLISLHVPLTRTGKNATYHLIDAKKLAQIKPQAIVINASRGAVIDNQALLNCLALDSGLAKHSTQRKPPFYIALDVWEGEPQVLVDLVPWVDIATAHIAGHSIEGKIRGSLQLFIAAAKHFDWAITELDWHAYLPLDILSVKQQLYREPNTTAITQKEQYEWVRACYNILKDDEAFRTRGLTAEGFDTLRKDYPIRRELSSVQIQLAQQTQKEQVKRLQTLGFEVELLQECQ